MRTWFAGPLGALCVLTLPLAASAQSAQTVYNPDPWFGRDKALHFGVSVGLSAAGYGLGAALAPESKWVPLATGAGLSLSLGIGKEVFDQLQGRHFSWKDLTWDALGTVTGLALSWAIDTFVIRPLLSTSRSPQQMAWAGRP